MGRERLIDGIYYLQKCLSIIQLDHSVEVHLLHLCINYKRFTFYKPPKFSRYPSDKELVRRLLGYMQWPNPASRLIKKKRRRRKEKEKKLIIRRNKVRPSQEKVKCYDCVLYNFDRTKKKTISLKWAFTHTGFLWDRIFSKCCKAEGFFRPLPIRTYVLNKCLLQYLWSPSYSADGEPVEKTCPKKKGDPPSWERRWP